jgi:hypothetical protein
MLLGLERDVLHSDKRTNRFPKLNLLLEQRRRALLRDRHVRWSRTRRQPRPDREGQSAGQRDPDLDRTACEQLPDLTALFV